MVELSALNWKGCERKRSLPNLKYLGNCLWSSRKTTKIVGSPGFGFECRGRAQKRSAATRSSSRNFHVAGGQKEKERFVREGRGGRRESTGDPCH